jgi:23S rRNA (uracil1939-C5)-methyltransferase
VHAVDSSEPALEALRAAIRRTQKLKPLTIETRDLFKRPLSDVELRGYDTAVMDPPRAGASAQTRSLAQSRIPTIVYVSCNPQSFARDARVLAAGGYNMGAVTPIDQFLWSSHIELVAVFSRN